MSAEDEGDDGRSLGALTESIIDVVLAARPSPMRLLQDADALSSAASTQVDRSGRTDRDMDRARRYAAEALRMLASDEAAVLGLQALEASAVPTSRKN